MTQKKGLIAYDTRYGSTAEVAYWLRALIGEDQAVEVKKLEQILTVKPYDYVIIGSYTRWEKSFKPTVPSPTNIQTFLYPSSSIAFLALSTKVTNRSTP